MAYYNISITPGLSPGERRRAARDGPRAVSTMGIEQRDLLTRAGFSVEAEIDVTAEFLATAGKWYAARERYADELLAADGEAALAERQADSAAQVRAIERGLLRRGLFVGRK